MAGNDLIVFKENSGTPICLTKHHFWIPLRNCDKQFIWPFFCNGRGFYAKKNKEVKF